VLPKNNAGFGDKPMQATNFGKPGDLPAQRAGGNYSLVIYLKDRQGARADRATRNLGLADEGLKIRLTK
jgi:hypothetical protein